MAVIYLIMIALPLILGVMVLSILRRWTHVPSGFRSVVAVLTAPTLLIVLYSQSSSTVDADERAAFAAILVAYLIASAVLVGLLEWRQRSKL
jgi:hypothetical protein